MAQLLRGEITLHFLLKSPQLCSSGIHLAPLLCSRWESPFVSIIQLLLSNCLLVRLKHFYLSRLFLIFLPIPSNFF